MRAGIYTQDGRLVAHPVGDLTEAMAHDLLEAIGAALGPVRDVVLDLGDVERIAVGALPYFFKIQERAQGADGKLVVAGAGPGAMRLFQMTRVAERLQLVPREASVSMAS